MRKSNFTRHQPLPLVVNSSVRAAAARCGLAVRRRQQDTRVLYSGSSTSVKMFVMFRKHFSEHDCLMAIFVLLVADSTAVPAVLATVVALFAAIYNCLPRRRVCNHFKTRCGHLAFHCAAMVTALGAVQASAGSQSAAQLQPLGAKASLLKASPVSWIFLLRADASKIALFSLPLAPTRAALRQRVPARDCVMPARASMPCEPVPARVPGGPRVFTT